MGQASSSVQRNASIIKFLSEHATRTVGPPIPEQWDCGFSREEGPNPSGVGPDGLGTNQIQYGRAFSSLLHSVDTIRALAGVQVQRLTNSGENHAAGSGRTELGSGSGSWELAHKVSDGEMHKLDSMQMHI